MRLPSRRGGFLTLFGIMYVLLGNAVLGADVTPVVRHVFRFALSIMPLWGYAVVWIACGAIAIVDGLLPRGRDTLGFVAAMIAPTVWAIIYFVAWLQHDTTVAGRLWESTVVYLLLVGAVGIVAGMPEPPPQITGR